MSKQIDMSNLNRIERIKALVTFVRTNELREELGWFEHTSDWDPFLIIGTDSETIETAAGYSDLEIINYKAGETIERESNNINRIKVYLEDEDNEDNFEPIEHEIEIDEIKKITWAAH